MTSFSASTLEKKLNDLSNTQQSVQTLSLWLIHHRKHAKLVVQTWNKEVHRAKPAKKLTLLYLANDVLQNSKKKGSEFNAEFKAALPSVFKHCSQETYKDATVKGMGRLLKIWSERGVFELSYIEKLRKLTNYEPPIEASPPPSKIARLDSASDEPAEPPDAEELIKALQELEQSASQDAVVREKIANLPAEVQDVSLLEKIEDKETGDRLTRIVDKACVLLAEYNGRLSAEMEDRVTLSKMLSSFLALQKDKLAETEKRLEEFRAKLDKVTMVRKELKSHLDNLPDLSKLPDVDGGLPPLPSAGDLFASSSGQKS
ncbi:regulation of nuclear pre-mRNA domain-containing protein 1B-like [Actinia tenebrosa]|uniref:Regulation of nuclear pre-mRNA domain-containing protein 1B-like n=1 Tax=Actinia tenebrosa TaxID=6105 RepID=A0A6P8ITN0_ACTTE|nr:regulation of nuclear pre-mRNA domain-containing protein 1B-like [Actinia tenebrosa]